jgi:uncharacterized membrane protein
LHLALLLASADLGLVSRYHVLLLFRWLFHYLLVARLRRHKLFSVLRHLDLSLACRFSNGLYLKVAD